MDLFEYGWSNLSILFARATCLFNDWSVWGYSSSPCSGSAEPRPRTRGTRTGSAHAGRWRPLLSAHAGRVDMSASNLSLFKTTKSVYTFIRCQKKLIDDGTRSFCWHMMKATNRRTTDLLKAIRTDKETKWSKTNYFQVKI